MNLADNLLTMRHFMRKKRLRILSVLQAITIITLFLFTTGANGDEKTFEYDNLGRLISATSSSDVHNSETSYEYDVVGNRVSKNVNSQYSVTITCNDNGASSHNGQLFVDENDFLTVTITPDNGYAVYNVYDTMNIWGSLWSRCQQTGNTVVLTLDPVSRRYDITIDFYRLTGLVGDVNGDCSVDDIDQNIMAINAHYLTYFKPCDLTGDNRVYIDDYQILMDHMGETCED